MKNLKNDPALADLPAPTTLTLEDLTAVAAQTGASLSGGIVFTPIFIAGGIRIPFIALQAVVAPE